MSEKMQSQQAKIVTQEEARIRWLKSLEEPDGKKFFPTGFKCHDQVAGRLRPFGRSITPDAVS